jgi:hypothetical protein
MGLTMRCADMTSNLCSSSKIPLLEKLEGINSPSSLAVVSTEQVPYEPSNESKYERPTSDLPVLRRCRKPATTCKPWRLTSVKHALSDWAGLPMENLTPQTAGVSMGFN